jgi:cytochrome c biogenesis protein CcdA
MLYFSLGRLFGYAIFGFVAGMLGGFIPFHIRPVIVAFANVFLGGILIYTSIRGAKKEICPAHKLNGIRNPAILGFLTGINICPPFILALT